MIPRLQPPTLCPPLPLPQVVHNISVPHSAWEAVGGVAHAGRDVVVTGWASRRTVIDWQGVTDVVDIRGHSVRGWPQGAG